MDLLLQQGIVYFFVIFQLNLIDLLGNTGRIPGSGWQYIFTCILADVPAYTLTPRFIISLREMYANDVQGRSSCGIDSGLGLSTFSSCDSVSTEPIKFVTDAQFDVTENIEADDMQDDRRKNVEVGQNEGREDMALV
ncbi:hypothetical protein JVU11DRAFT_10434 [Chiua virens]|nr:hypothetical protein JVU11DRAFT_10434 [Chiua virens]